MIDNGASLPGPLTQRNSNHGDNLIDDLANLSPNLSLRKIARGKQNFLFDSLSPQDI